MKFQPACLVLLFLGGLHLVHESSATCLTFPEYIALGSLVTKIDCVKGVGNAPPTIPATIATLINLEELRIIDDNLQGTLPTQLALLTKLTKIQIEENAVVGTVPLLSALTALTMLKIRNNPTLNPGPIPDIFGAMPNFRSIDFRNTKRTGTLPVSLTTRTLIEYVRLGENSLKGTISETIGSAPDLRTISLFDNQFTGRVPRGVARAAVDTIRIENNQFSGTLEGYDFPLFNVDELRVQNTRMYGQMPAFNLNLNGQSDITAGQTLGDFIANGQSCVGKTDKCSSGATSCGAVNTICCAPIYTAPNVRVPCASGLCTAGTGVCEVVITTSPTALPTTLAPETSAPTSGDVAVSRPTAPPPRPGDGDGAEGALQVGLGVGIALSAIGIFIVGKRRQRANAMLRLGFKGQNESPSALLYGNGSATSFASGGSFAKSHGTSLYTGEKESIL